MFTLSKESYLKIPWAKAVPYDNNDILICLSSNVSILMKNIRDFNGKRFSIAAVMTSDSHKDTFFSEAELKEMKDDDGKKKVFQDRLKSFAGEMECILERYFITNKMPRYIFFDKKEQEFLSKMFSSMPWSCEISVLRRGEEIDITTLSPAGIQNLNKLLKPMSVKVELGLSDYLRLMGKKVKFDFKNREELLLDRIFRDYPELKVEDLASFKKIVKQKFKELHPDKNDSDTAENDFNKFKTAVDELKNTAWYRKLENKEVS